MESCFVDPDFPTQTKLEIGTKLVSHFASLSSIPSNGRLIFRWSASVGECPD
jgi:hypothetical protein